MCTKCGIAKPLDEFHRHPTRGTQSWCKTCRKTYDRAYHAATRDLRVRQKRIWKDARTLWGRSLKEGRPCADCGLTFHFAAMQWDHRPGTVKLFDLGRAIPRYSREAILDEMAKCDLVCANCHAVRTYERRRDVAQPG